MDKNVPENKKNYNFILKFFLLHTMIILRLKYMMRKGWNTYDESVHF